MGFHEKIIIADDLPILQETLRACLAKSNYTVVGVAGSFKELEELVRSGIPFSVLFQDSDFPADGDGQRAAGMVRRMRPEVKVVSFSGSMERQVFGDLNLRKPLSPAEIIRKIDSL